MVLNGTIIGYDPGGNAAHGLALVRYQSGRVVNVEVSTHDNVYSMLAAVAKLSDVVAIGVDTLTCWSTGPSGWRPADRWLKERYPQITNSIASANSLFGAMGLNGMAVLIKLRELLPGLLISETHPKVLCLELSKEKYDYKNRCDEMDQFLNGLIGCSVTTMNDHEWDARISVYAVQCGLTGKWNRDLHGLNSKSNEELVFPCGVTNYWWP